MKRRTWSNVQRDTMAWALIVGLLIMVGVAALYLVTPQMTTQTKLHLGDGIFTADIVQKQQADAVKSSELRELEPQEAVLFTYASDDWWPVEVKHRSGSFDAVWLDRDKKVVYIVKNISSEQNRNTTFSPSKAARYVVELSVGTVEKRSIAIGAVAQFDDAQVSP